MINKKDIQMFLDLHRKTIIKWDNMDYYVYPKHIIEACLKDYKQREKQ